MFIHKDGISIPEIKTETKDGIRLYKTPEESVISFYYYCSKE